MEESHLKINFHYLPLYQSSGYGFAAAVAPNMLAPCGLKDRSLHFWRGQRYSMTRIGLISLSVDAKFLVGLINQSGDEPHPKLCETRAKLKLLSYLPRTTSFLAYALYR